MLSICYREWSLIIARREGKFDLLDYSDLVFVAFQLIDCMGELFTIKMAIEVVLKYYFSFLSALLDSLRSFF